MMIRRSLQARLTATFILTTIIASISGIIGTYFVDSTANSLDEVIQEQVQLKDQVRIAELELVKTLVTLKTALTTHRNLDQAEAEVAASVQRFEASIESIRRHLVDFPADSADGDLIPVFERSTADLAALRASTDDVLGAHRAVSALIFDMDGQTVGIAAVLDRIAIEFIDWVGSIEEAVRFDTEFAGNRDADKTTFARWHAMFKATDPELKELLDNFALAQSKTYDYAVNKVLLAPKERQESQFVRMVARRVAKAKSALDMFRAHVVPQYQQLLDQEAEQLAAVTDTTELLQRDFADFRDLVTRQVDQSAASAIATASFAATITAAILAGALVSAIAIGWALGRTISRPIRTCTDAVAELAKGNLVEVPGRDRQDELGELGRSLDRVYQRGLEATRLRSALDCCGTMVMVAGSQLNIVYLNPILDEFFERHIDAIKRDLPQFDHKALIGQPIDIFHKNAGATRDMITKMQAPHRIRFTLGGRRLNLMVSPIRQSKGEFVGTVVEWMDMTAEISVQEQMDAVIAAASRGDFSQRISLQQAEGAYAELASGMNQLTEVVEQATNDLDDMLDAMAKGDLGQRITTSYEGKFGQLKDNANNTAQQLAEIVAGIQGAAAEVADAAREITSGTEDLSGRTELAASNLQETAASTEEMTASVRQNADNASNADQLASSANQNALEGGRVVAEAVGAMTKIDDSAQNITEIINVIDEIAFQTNLLALNASVEAARAGEAGKGFAVVAQEVRQLAQRSASAAADIKGLIQTSNGLVSNGVDLVNRTGASLRNIVDAIGQLAGIVKEISNASNEQSTGVQEINSSITSLDEMTQQNSALVEESSASARILGEQAAKLNELVGFFKLQDAPSPCSNDRKRRQGPDKRPSDTSSKNAITRIQPTDPDTGPLVTANDNWSEF